MPLEDLPLGGRFRQFVKSRPAISNLCLVGLLVLALSFSCARVFTGVLEAEREPQFRRHFAYGLLGPTSHFADNRDFEWVVLVYLGIFALVLVGLTRMKFGCLSMTVAGVIAFLWFAIGFMVAGAPYW